MGAISLPSVLIGCGIVGIGYFLFLCATKGIPAAWAWLKSKLSAASADYAALKADFQALESGVVATVQNDVAILKADVAIIKTKVGA